MSTIQTRATAKFYAESFAPWCERARWALDHHCIAYCEVEQAPVLAELSLRIAKRSMSGRVTVPLLVQGGNVMMNSDAIARHAERVGSGARLFLAQDEYKLVEWMKASETLMMAGRALLLPRMLGDAQALGEQLPAAVPSALRGRLRWLAVQGVRHLMRKYGVDELDHDHHVAQVRQALLKLRVALDGTTMHVLGNRFTFADITMASALQFILPVADKYILLGPATRRVWTHTSLATDFADLLAWRDWLYEQYRWQARRPALSAPIEY